MILCVCAFRSDRSLNVKVFHNAFPTTLLFCTLKLGPVSMEVVFRQKNRNHKVTKRDNIITNMKQ